jgi:alpha-methylacyl-CoA racemase
MASEAGPLSGVRVIEIAGIGPLPFAAMVLADLGAEVLRVDRPGGGLAVVAPEADIMSRGRRSVALDLKHPRAIETALQLVSRADILIEGFRPGVAERLGIGPDACLARNPALVYGRMTGWGQDGPLATAAGHDVSYISLTGALGSIGRAGGPPQIPLNLVGDFGGGSLYLVTGVLAALLHARAILHARASGRGQVVDAAITDGVAHLMALFVAMRQQGTWGEERGTNMLDSGAPFYDVYETADRRYMSVGAIEGRFYRQLLDGLGLAEAPDREDPYQWPALRTMIAARFAQRTQQEWSEVFADTDACVFPVLTIDEALEHPHNVARDTFPASNGVRQPAPAPRFSLTPTRVPDSPHAPGADTETALSSWGIESVAELIDCGAAVQIPMRAARSIESPLD